MSTIDKQRISAVIADAAATETATTDARTKAQAAYDRAQAELDALAIAKPAAEIQSLIEAAKTDLAKLPTTRTVAELEALQRAASQRGCHAGATLSGQTRAKCPDYSVELARAWERKNLTSRIAELTQDAGRAGQRRTDRQTAAKLAMDKASAELSRDAIETYVAGRWPDGLTDGGMGEIAPALSIVGCNVATVEWHAQELFRWRD